MTHAARIRAWLSTQDGPRTIPEITAGLGLSQPDGLTAHSVHRMFREAMHMLGNAVPPKAARIVIEALRDAA